MGAGLLLAGLLVGMSPAPAAAGGTLVPVTTELDVVNAGDGVTSLREAFTIAASTSSPIIVVPDGSHLLLTLCGPEEDANASGDLDHFGASGLYVRSATALPYTIEQTCPATDGARVIEAGSAGIRVDYGTVTGGQPFDSGGGIYSAGHITMTGSTVTGNEIDEPGGFGGGLFAEDGIGISQTTISDNTASEGAGGMYAGDFLNVNTSSVEGNTSSGPSGGGGAIAVGEITVYWSYFGRNSAVAMSALGSVNSAVTVQRSTIAWNHADLFAAVRGPNNGLLSLTDTTFVGNEGPLGGGADVYADDLEIANTVLAENRGGGPHCERDPGGITTSAGNSYVTGDTSCGLAVGDVQAGAPSGLRFPFANGGTTLTAYPSEGSPLVDGGDTGLSACQNVDQRFVARPQPTGGACDIGAVEVEPCGAVFGDVSPTHPFCWEIGWMEDAGITTGFPGTPPTYQPSSPVTRQSMSAFLYRFAGSPPFEAPPTSTFADVGLTHPFYDEIEWMADEGITTGFPGVPKPTYRPSTAVSRQSMSAFMYRFVGASVPPPPVATFADVSTGHQFFEEIEWMAAEGITTGFPGSPLPTYRPNDAVTRQSMSAFLYRLAALPT
jgi:hypothetical protein